jgi:hypothetical protein
MKRERKRRNTSLMGARCEKAMMRMVEFESERLEG